MPHDDPSLHERVDPKSDQDWVVPSGGSVGPHHGQRHLIGGEEERRGGGRRRTGRRRKKSSAFSV